MFAGTCQHTDTDIQTVLHIVYHEHNNQQFGNKFVKLACKNYNMATLQVLMLSPLVPPKRSNIWLSRPEREASSVCCCKTTTCFWAGLKPATRCLYPWLFDLTVCWASTSNCVFFSLCQIGLWLNNSGNSYQKFLVPKIIWQTSAVRGCNCLTNMSTAFYQGFVHVCYCCLTVYMYLFFNDFNDLKEKIRSDLKKWNATSVHDM